VTALDALRDAQSRVTRALEALADGELGLAGHLLDDLDGDISSVLERLEVAGEETAR
jgi:hypothetical protein